MKYCKRCVMPNTRPGIHFDAEGVCAPCRAVERRATIDWGKRQNELAALCAKHRGRRGDYYDCIIAVSGGKDSHYQVHVMKNEMGMNPLLVSVDNFSWTQAGRRNFENIGEAFGCDIVSLSLNRKAARKMLRIALAEYGSPTWYWDRAVYVFPLRMAINFNIPLIVYGENVAHEYGGKVDDETPSALGQINNDVVIEVNWDVWHRGGVTKRDLQGVVYPTTTEMDNAHTEPTYLSYYRPWDGVEHLNIARRHGFRDLKGEWKREGYVEDYDQIDAIGYLVHCWMKYPKFGHARATDLAASWVRHGYISRPEGIELVKNNDHLLDQKALRDFLEFTGYTHREFWDIVDRYYNRDIFEKVKGEWKLKAPIWEESDADL